MGKEASNILPKKYEVLKHTKTRNTPITSHHIGTPDPTRENYFHGQRMGEIM